MVIQIMLVTIFLIKAYPNKGQPVLKATSKVKESPPPELKVRGWEAASPLQTIVPQMARHKTGAYKLFWASKINIIAGSVFFSLLFLNQHNEKRKIAF